MSEQAYKIDYIVTGEELGYAARLWCGNTGWGVSPTFMKQERPKVGGYYVRYYDSRGRITHEAFVERLESEQ